MKLTQEDIEKFKYYADNRIEVIIEGKNYIGQPFETEGVIIYDHNNPDAKRLETHSVAIFQGRYLDSSFWPGTKKDYALFFTEPVKNLNECLYIESIRTAKDSKPIFTNPDFSDIISKSIESNQEAYREGQDLNDAAREILPLIGQPVAEVDNRGYHSQTTMVAVRCIKGFQGRKEIVTDFINPGFNVLTGPRRSMVATSIPHIKVNLIEDYAAGSNLVLYGKELVKHGKQEMERE